MCKVFKSLIKIETNKYLQYFIENKNSIKDMN